MKGRSTKLVPFPRPRRPNGKKETPTYEESVLEALALLELCVDQAERVVDGLSDSLPGAEEPGPLRR